MLQRSEKLLAEMRSIERRMREQIERHLRVDPTGNIGRIVAIQLQQEREKLELRIDEADGSQAEELVALLAWLPQLEHQLKRRAS